MQFLLLISDAGRAATYCTNIRLRILADDFRTLLAFESNSGFNSGAEKLSFWKAGLSFD
jgi:hypothetical protein